MDFLNLDYIAEFDTKVDEFSVKNALFLAKASNLVYSGRFEMEYITEEIWHYPNFAFIDNASFDTQAFVIGNEEAIIVAFRGTESKVDTWVTNADLDMVHRFGGKVHRGFMKAVESVWEDIVKCLNDFHTNKQNIWFCGHSMGGALAMLTVAKLLEADIPVKGLYTFGQPRVGNQNFADFFNQRFKAKTYRIVAHRDVVTRTPPQSLGFSHAGTFVYLTEEGQISHDMSYWDNFWGSMSNTLSGYLDLLIDEVAEHKLKTYMDGLEKGGLADVMM